MPFLVGFSTLKLMKMRSVQIYVDDFVLFFKFQNVY